MTLVQTLIYVPLYRPTPQALPQQPALARVDGAFIVVRSALFPRKLRESDSKETRGTCASCPFLVLLLHSCSRRAIRCVFFVACPCGIVCRVFVRLSYGLYQVSSFFHISLIFVGRVLLNGDSSLKPKYSDCLLYTSPSPRDS